MVLKRMFFAAALVMIAVPARADSASNGCPAGWTRIDNVRVTGCCTPREEEFSSRAAYFEAVKREGWGRDEDGRYRGWWDGAWHFSAVPMNMHGGQLDHTSLAVDPSFISHGRQVMIPGLPSMFSSITFTADDDGPDIDGRWVNIWLGEGKRACSAGRIDRRYSICVK